MKHRWALRVALYPGLVVSLLAYPAGLPWMILAWIVLFAAELLRGRPCWMYAAIPAILALVKRVDGPPALLVLLALLVAAACGAPRLARARSRASAAVALLLAGWVWLLWAWTDAAHTRRRPAFDPSRPIVCVGDSLTAHAYPRELAKLVGAPVMDQGRGGTTSSEIRAALPRSLALKPQAVVVTAGGNDFQQDRPRAEVAQALEGLILDCRAAGVEVILFEIPRGFVYDPYGGLERALARKHDLELVTDGAVRSLVLRSPWFPVKLGEELSYDGIHPNEAGNAHLARHAARALERVFGRLR